MSDGRIGRACFSLLFLTLTACGSGDGGGGLPTTDDVEIPEQCQLDENISVAELSFRDVGDRIELSEGETRPVKVWAKLESAAPPGAVTVICFVVRDVQVGFSPILANGFTAIQAGRTEPTIAVEGFSVTCRDGKVAGISTLTAPFGGDGADASSNERSTQIFLQHTGELRTFLNTETVTGLQGVRSDRIRVVCD